MITVDKQPALIDLSGGPLPLWITSDNENVVPGAVFLADIQFSAIPPNQSELNMSWQDGVSVANILFDPVPDDSGNEIANFGVGVSTWITNTLIPGLQSNYLLDRDFTFELVGSDTLRMLSRVRSTDYIVSFSTVNLPAVIVDGGAQDIQPRENFGIQVILDYSPMSDTTVIFRHEKFLNTVNGTAFFEISDPLKFLHNKALPDYPQLGIKDVSDNVIRYRYRFCESYGDVRSKLQASVWKYLLPGGRSDAHILAEPDFYNFITENGTISRFLTYHTERVVGPDEPLYLTYLHRALSSLAAIRVEIHFTDGSTVTQDLAPVAAVANHLYVADAGYKKIEPYLVAGKTLSHWEVYMYQAGKITNTISVSLQAKKQLDKVDLLYRNALGAFEIWRCNGALAHQTEFVQQMATHFIAWPTMSSERRSQVIESEFIDTLEVNSGYMSKENIGRFRDLLNSKEVYLAAGGWVPVTIKPDELTRETTNSGRLNAHTLVLQFDRQNFFSHV